MNKSIVLGWSLLVSLVIGTGCAVSVEPPAPHGALPSARQVKWAELEMYAFVHFTTNTFTDKEWGFGDESPEIFAPTGFDADQIVRTFKEAGLKGVMLTCKHHDGFCLWPSKYTEHSVKNSKWKNGKGDVVREMSEACKKHGLLFGVYLSPWDRNHKDYASPAYITYFRNQLRELLTNYGPIFEVWFDGANGGDGFYGGARERRRIDNKTYYDWDNTWSIVRELHPDACMFSDGGPDVRWVGNESGFAGETCWATINREGMLPGVANNQPLTQGHRNGTHWLPAEVDVSIRPGWFYHQHEDAAVKSVARLTQIYYESVGRGANLILNIPPDRRGIVHEIDAANLKQWGKNIAATFATDLAAGATVTASNTRGGDAKFAPANVLDGKRDTYWATDDAVKTPELVIDLGKPVTFNVVRVREFLPLGQRIDSIALDYWKDGAWTEFATATSIGSQRLVRTRYLTTTKVRLRVTAAAACPAISEVGLFASPMDLSEPRISRDKQGNVSIACENVGPWIRYTTDGAEPSAQSSLYEKPFALPAGGTVKARAFLPLDNKQSGLSSATFGLAKGSWKIAGQTASAKGSSAARAIDEDPKSIFMPDGAQALPHQITIDLGKSAEVSAVTFLPKPNAAGGVADRYELFISDQNNKWGPPAAQGEFANIQANPVEQLIKLSRPAAGRFVKLVFTHVTAGKEAAVAEIGVIGK